MAKYEEQNKNSYNSATQSYSELKILGTFLEILSLRMLCFLLFHSVSIIREHVQAIKCFPYHTIRNNASANIFVHKTSMSGDLGQPTSPRGG